MRHRLGLRPAAWIVAVVALLVPTGAVPASGVTPAVPATGALFGAHVPIHPRTGAMYISDSENHRVLRVLR